MICATASDAFRKMSLSLAYLSFFLIIKNKNKNKKTPLLVAYFESATDNNALSFLLFEFYFYHCYY
jgi:hypothetical protein